MKLSKPVITLLNLERTNQSKLIKKETEKNLNRAQFLALNL